MHASGEPTADVQASVGPAAEVGAEDALITVIVCTRDRATILPRTLASLALLDDANFEILVVDNNDEPMRSLPTMPYLRVVHEPRPGLAFARNLVVEAAGGSIVAFVDDDCEADPGWLRGIRTGFADAWVGGVTGRVIAARTDLLSARLFEWLSSFDRGPFPRDHVVPAGTTVLPGTAAELGSGCNMAYRKEIFSRVGTFDPALDTPTIVRGGGDLDMFARVLECGVAVRYVAEAEVVHHHRERLRGVARQLLGYGVGIGALSSKYVLEGRASWRAVWAYQRHVIRWMVGQAWRARHRRLAIVLVACEIAGIALGPFAYAITRRRNRGGRA